MSNPYGSSKTAEDYARFRPCYSKELAQHVVEFCMSGRKGSDSSTKLGLMVDVGCGSGQSSALFQPYFDKIIATDISKEQLQQGRMHNVHQNIEFTEGSEAQIPAEEQSVDVVVCGAAAQWFDLKKFFDEVQRILKPSGCVAIFGYWTPKISSLLLTNEEGSKAASELFEKAVLDSVGDEPVKTKAYLHLKNRYEDIFEAVPFKNKQRVDHFHLVNESSISDLIGYMKSSDSYLPYMEKKIGSLKTKNQTVTKEMIDSVDYVVKYINQLKVLLKLKNSSDSEKVLKLDYNFFMLLAKN